jgi:hypothetical protein
MKLYSTDCASLMRAAKQLDEEATTWREGFASEIDGKLQWDKECDFAQIHFIHCTTSAAFLRGFVKRLSLIPAPPDAQTK